MKDTDNRTAAEIEAWIREYLGRMLGLDAATIDDNKPFQRFGLDSAAAVELSMDLSDWLGHEIEPTVIFEHRTVRALAAHAASAAS